MLKYSRLNRAAFYFRILFGDKGQGWVMETVTVKNVKIGEGIPKICVPVVSNTKKEILSDTLCIVNSRADMIEWRADWYNDALNLELIKDVLKDLSFITKHTPLLFTLRTSKEGGNVDIPLESYTEINKGAIASGFIDLIDIEAFADEAVTRKLIECAHAANVKVIGSSHHFDTTPPKREIIDRMRRIQDLGADISKIAVMPRCEADVSVLLDAAATVKKNYARKPIAAISMTKMGVSSRTSGELFGSCLTFGAIKNKSAPGQIDPEELYHILRRVHKSIQEKKCMKIS